MRLRDWGPIAILARCIAYPVLTEQVRVLTDRLNAAHNTEGILRQQRDEATKRAEFLDDVLLTARRELAQANTDTEALRIGRNELQHRWDLCAERARQACGELSSSEMDEAP